MAVPDFRQELAGPPGLILYLADNAGEQFFDRPLVASLRRRGWRVLYAVKAGPIQNDLTLEDLEASGLREALEPVVDTGARTVGLELHRVSPGFRELYDGRPPHRGQGHGTLRDHESSGRPPGLVPPPGQVRPRGPGPGGGRQRLRVRPEPGDFP